MSALMLALVLAQGPTNLLQNGDLSKSLGVWQFMDGGISTATPKADEGRGRLQVDVRHDAQRPPWTSHLIQSLNYRFRRGDRLRLSFWARSPQSLPLVAFFEQAAEPYLKELLFDQRLTPTWTAYEVTAELSQSYIAGGSSVGFHFNLGTGTYEIGNVSLTRLAEGPRGSSVGVLNSDPLGTMTVRECRLTRTGDAVTLQWERPADPNPWSVGAFIPSERPIDAGDTVMVSLEARSRTRSRVGVHFERSSAPHTKYVSGVQSFGPDWRAYRFAGVMSESVAASEAQISMHLGFADGEVELRNVKLENLGEKPLGALNLTIEYFGGVPNPDDWRAAANQRIERIRKGDLGIRVVDERGRQVPNAAVRVEQQRHAFRFGTAVPARMVNLQGPDGDRYRAVLRRLFNTAVFENDHKWNALETREDPAVRQAMRWLRAHNFEIRGHTLVWGSRRNLPLGLWEMSDEEVLRRVRERIQKGIALHPGELYAWDVVNEAVTEVELWDRLGWNRFADAFRWAREANPNMKLVYNDFDGLEENQAGPDKRRRVQERIQFLLDNGAPLDIIGLQGHVSIPLTPGSRIVELLDDFRKFNLPIEITEFDAGVHDDAVHADYTRDYLTACFSHPSVEGFLFWGFWEGSHWRAREGGHMYRRDWTPRPAATVVNDLIRNKWWTSNALRTGPDGSGRTRAFFGTHRVTARSGNRSGTATVELERGSRPVVTVQLSPVR